MQQLAATSAESQFYILQIKTLLNLTCLEEELLPEVEAMLARVAEVDQKLEAAYQAECDRIQQELEMQGVAPVGLAPVGRALGMR